jgi:hypothetical protein
MRSLRLLASLTAMVALVLPAQAQLAVVSAPSVDRVLDDVRYLIKSMGREQDLPKFEQMVGVLTNALDTTKPLGLYVNAPEKGSRMSFVAFIPVDKEREFLELLETLHLPPVKEARNLYRLTLPNESVARFRFMNGYCVASDQADKLPAALPNLAELAKPDNPHSMLTARLRLQDVSTQAREEFLEGFKRGSAQAAARAELNEQIVAIGKKINDNFGTRLIMDLDEVTASVDVNRQAGKVSMGMALHGRPESELTKWLQSVGKQQNRFNNLADDSAFHILAALPLPAELRNLALDKFEDLVFQAEQQSPPEQRALIRKWGDAVKASLVMERYELGTFFHGPHADGSYVFILALGSSKARQLESVILEVAKQGAIPEFKSNVAKVGDIPIHSLKGRNPTPSDFLDLVQSSDMHAAFPDQGIVLAVGKHGLPGIKEALGRLGKPLRQRSSAIEMEMSIRRSPGVLTKNNPAPPELMKRAFVGADRDRDKLLLTIQGGDALRFRYEVDTAVLRLLAMMAEAKQ